MKKRFLSVFLALALCMGLAVPAFAAGSDFVIENGVLVEYTGSGGAVTIPDGVTSIAFGAFEGCAGLTSVTIPNSVTSIGDSAFAYCDQLTGVTIPNSVTNISYGAFYCTSLTSVTIPNSVTSIGNSAFADCTGLTGVIIPESVTSIGGSAFSGTPWLKAQGEFAVVNGILLAYQGSGGAVVIPDGVTNIGESAFSDCTGLTSVTIPSSVTSISDGAFVDCTNLTSVTIPGSVTSIGGHAFTGTPWLEAQSEFPTVNGILLAYQGSGGRVVIPDSVTSISKFAFMWCGGLTSVVIPNSVTSIGEASFYGCRGLTSITIPNSVTSIGVETFVNCEGLTSVTIPDSVTTIGYGAFIACTGLTDVYYSGTEAQWKAVAINNENDGNDPLLNATIHYNSPMPAFTDVSAGAFYADAVNWAVEQDITNGTGGGRFSPGQNCTHAQILTFLYRAARGGGTASAGDMDKAIAWAREKGMIGADFNPGAPCNRAYAMQYIWQAFDRPASTGTASFTDVPAGWSSAPAVSWAVDNGITNGTSAATFSPSKVCTRGEIVTFLHRAYVPSARLK